MKLSKVLVAVLACASFILAQEAAAPAAAPAKQKKAQKKEATTVVREQSFPLTRCKHNRC